MIAEPIFVKPDVGYANESANERFHRDPQIEIERLFPHGHQKYGVPRLAKIFLSNLQLDRLVCFFKSAEEWRGGLADLEVDRAVLDLDHDVVVELAVQVLEVVIGGSRAIVLGIAP